MANTFMLIKKGKSQDFFKIKLMRFKPRIWSVSKNVKKRYL